MGIRANGPDKRSTGDWCESRNGDAQAKFVAMHEAQASGDTGVAEACRNEIYEHFSPRLTKLVSALSLPTEDVGDLFSDGALALLRAIEEFDPARGVRFWSYAEAYIRGELKGTRSRDHLVHIPESDRRLRRRFEREEALLTCELGRPPSISESAAHLGVDELRLGRALTTPRIISVDGLELAGAMDGPFDGNWDDCDDGLTAPGGIFGQAVLLAVLPLEIRSKALSAFLSGEWPRGSSHKALARKVWSEMEWPVGIIDRDTPTARVSSALRSDLASNNPVVRENAAYAIWLVHACPQLRCLYQKSELEALVASVTAVMLSSTDTTLHWIGIHLQEAEQPERVIFDPPSATCVYHIANGPALKLGSLAFDRLVTTHEDAIASLAAGTSGSWGPSTLAKCWDIPCAMARRPAMWRDVGPALESESKDAHHAYRYAAAATRLSAEEAFEAFVRALREDRVIRSAIVHPRKLPNLVERCLDGQEARPMGTYRRRLAVAQFRFLEADERCRLLSPALHDRSPFVRLSAVSALREMGDVDSCNELRAYVARHAGARRKDIQSLETCVGAIVRLAPATGYDVCSALARSSTAELRGRAIGSLGELMHRYHGIDRLRVGERLCQRTSRIREGAVTMAQLLLACRGLSIRQWIASDFGLSPRFRLPVWRSDWYE